MRIYKEIREDIIRYVFDDIVSRYAGFDPAHRENHALTVIEQAMELMDRRESWLSGQSAETAALWSEEIDREGHIERAVAHLKEKYGRGGYLKLWIPWSDNAARLNDLQNTIADDSAIHRETVRIYASLI